MQGKQQSLPEGIETYAAVTGIARVNVLVALGVVKFRHRSRDDTIAGQGFTEVDRRQDDRESTLRYGREILDHENRGTLVVFLRCETHGKTVAMGVLQVPVHPRLSLARQVPRQLPSRQHDLAVGVAHPVPVHVDVAELVVGSNPLELPKGLAEGTPIPEANVADGLVVPS